MKRITLLILVCYALIFIAGCGQEPRVATVGEQAPDFTLVDLEGKTWSLSDLRGQVVFVNFWATWCPPCIEEMPSMQKLYTMMPQDKFKMLAILNNDNPALAKTVAAKIGMTMPILVDPNSQVSTKYGLTGVPETFIIDKEGVLREKFLGPAPWDSSGAVQMLMGYINK